MIHINPEICANCKDCYWVLERRLDSVHLTCAHTQSQNKEKLRLDTAEHVIRFNFLMMLSLNDKDYWFLRNFIDEEISEKFWDGVSITEFRVGYVDDRLIDFCKEKVICSSNCPYYLEHMLTTSKEEENGQEKVY